MIPIHSRKRVSSRPAAALQDNSAQQILNSRPTSAEIYHENSKVIRASISQLTIIERARIDRTLMNFAERSFKTYQSSQVICLPDVQSMTDVSLESAIRDRRSMRKFGKGDIGLESIGSLLFHTNGCTAGQGLANGWRNAMYRTAPSPGALHPMEVFLAIDQPQAMPTGFYYYSAPLHRLELVKYGNVIENIARRSIMRDVIEGASIVLVLVAVFARCAIKYGERGYRYTMIEAGHIAQNSLLWCGAHNQSGVPIGGFYDDEVNQLLGFDGVDEAVIYLVAIGARD